ncbi:30S ribosomal protein S7 [Candidatus Berkelbacteria bacterium]|nr:30S ribosomal protein S7 [Candidatus Berkelbacteria bacterium]
MRGKAAKQRPITPDAKYNSTVVAKLINHLMLRGQKLTSTTAVYKAMDRAEKELKQPALDVLDQALKNIAPMVEVKSKRVGGATYQVPIEVKSNRKQTLAMRWMIEAARSAKGTIDKTLGDEIVSAYKGEGASIKKREDVHRMAESNKAFAHYARF